MNNGNSSDDHNYYVGGSLPSDAPSYVARPADQQIYELLHSGEYCYVLNSRQMGKSSLRVRLMARLQTESIACASIDISLIGTEAISPQQWYGSLLSTLVRELELEGKHDTRDWFSDRHELTPVLCFGQFIEEILLKEIAQPLIIFIDEIDSILELDFKDDFFAFIRGCHEKKAEHTDYRRLTFVLIGVATPGSLIRNAQASSPKTPFNIGHSVELHGFQLSEVQPLIKNLAGKASNPEAVLQAVLSWTGGQPFLTQKICKLVHELEPFFSEGAEAQQVERIVRTRVIENWEFKDFPEHLKTIRDRILSNTQKSASLLGLYQQIQKEKEIAADDSVKQMELRLSGLVVEQQGKLRVYNRIYELVFNKSWVDKELANLRPYSEAITAWMASHRRDESRLLSGQALKDALAWSSDKSLDEVDNKFLSKSQTFDNREIQVALETEKKARSILTKAQQAATRRIRIGSVILVMTLVSAAIVSLFASHKLDAAKLELDKTNADAQLAKEKQKKAEQQILKTNKQLVTTKSELLKKEGLNKALEKKRIELNKQARQAKKKLNHLEIAAQDAREQTQNARNKLIVEQNKAKIEKVIAWNSISQGLLRSNDQLGALIASVKAGRQLLNIKTSSNIIRQQTMNTLKQAICGTQNCRVQEQNRLEGHKDWISGLSFSPDGQTIASASRDESLKLWSRDGRLLKTFRNAGHWHHNSVSFSPDGQTIATIGKKDTINLINPEGRLLKTFKGHSDLVESVNFSPDGQIVMSASSDRTIKLWSLHGDNNLIRTLTGHTGRVRDAKFSPDGQTIVTASLDWTVKIWNRSGKLLSTCKGHNKGVNSVSFSPDGQTIASASDDESIKLWSLDGKLLKTLEGHRGEVVSVSFSPDGQTIASASRDETIKLWSRNGIALKTFRGHSHKVVNVKFSPDGQTIASASSDKIIKLWSSDHSFLKTMKGHTRQIRKVRFSPDGQTLASASIDGTIKLWNRTGALLRTLEGHSSWIWDISFSSDDQTIASASADGTVKLWRSRDGQLLRTLKGHKGNVLGASFSSDDQTIASASADGTVKLWRSRDGQLLRTLNSHGTRGFSVSFSLDDQLIVSAYDNNTVKLWRSRDGQLLRTLKFNKHRDKNWHAERVPTLSLSPNGQIIALTTIDNDIKLLDLRGRSLVKLEGHTDWVSDISFSPNGQIIASASDDSTVKLWRSRDGQLLRTLNGPRGRVGSISFSADGQTLAAAHDDMTIVLWKGMTEMPPLSLNELLVSGCNSLHDYLKSNLFLDQTERHICDNI